MQDVDIPLLKVMLLFRREVEYRHEENKAAQRMAKRQQRGGKRIV